MLATPSPGPGPAGSAAEVEVTYASDLSPEVLWYLESRGYELPDHVEPLWRTPEPRNVSGAMFDPARVDKAIRALSTMRHTQGKWAGRPLTPDAWQVAYIVAPVFGWVRDVVDDDGTMYRARIIRSAWVEVPRKNGKTTISAGLGLVLAFGDDEPGAQVYAAAASKDQAMQAYRPAKLIAEGSPAFKKAGIRALAKQIVRDDDQSFMTVVAAVGDLLQGTNPNGYIVDELHVHKSADVIDALESGTGARSQPLGIIITTADDGGALTVYADRRARIEQLCRGVIQSASEYAVIFGARRDEDPFAESTWQVANPGYPVSPTRAFMADEAEKAKTSPANLARFLRLNLNVRTKQNTRYIDLDAWDRNAGTVDETKLLGQTCYGGLDLASVSDLSAFCLVFPQYDGTFKALWRFWTPEENVASLDKRTNGAASRWVKAGWIKTTPGNVTDYDYIETAILRDFARFDLRSIGFDPYNATQLSTRLQGHGLPMVETRQGFITLSPPLKECQRLLLQGTAEHPVLQHGANPVMRWMTDNLAVEYDAAENVKPSKKAGGTSGNKIDGWSALVTAMSEVIADDALGGIDADDVFIA